MDPLISTILGCISIIILIAYFVTIYNHLVSIKHNIDKAWSNIDVLLVQRHDELLKLVELCRQYMVYERETIEKIVSCRATVGDARQRVDIRTLGPAESRLRAALVKLYGLVEAYPNLKANEIFQRLQKRISELENQITDRRVFYNESVTSNNIRIKQFPDSLVAGLFNFLRKDLLRFNKVELENPDLKNAFSRES